MSFLALVTVACVVVVVFADAAIAVAVKCWGQMLDVILLALIEVFHVVRVLYSHSVQTKKTRVRAVW